MNDAQKPIVALRYQEVEGEEGVVLFHKHMGEEEFMRVETLLEMGCSGGGGSGCPTCQQC